ncbi:hypothetical protein [Streptomyces roseirectus]|uniref:hypothetical protein n=1 Tax=Streptomyces roseirectus TaxID=2768066 RepID=UPI001FE52B5B|nr:hypothetical protein [Streptomyces roseirectus]
MIDTRLSGRNVLVTGGAGNIGAAVSRAFAAQGARVAVHYLPRDPLAPEGVSWAHVTPGEETAVALAGKRGNSARAAARSARTCPARTRCAAWWRRPAPLTSW